METIPGDEIVISVEGTRWSFDTDFLASTWECIWGRGCQGIEDAADEPAQLGCCSVGAQLLDDDEARRIDALGSALDPALFELHYLAGEIGVLDESGIHTRVAAGRCIFHNSVEFPGGPGCALHLSAVAAGEDPLEWKPSVCWQLPVRVERSRADDGTPLAHLRAWTRADWGPGGETMAWCCTDRSEAPEAFTSAVPVIEGLERELRALVGDDGYDELRHQLG